MAKTRYLVEWAAYADALAAAMAKGMPADGAISDYVDVNDFDRESVATNFGEAVTKAREILPFDVWGCPRIRRQVMAQNDHDDLGNRVEACPSFRTEATWEVFGDLPDPSEDNPDWID